MLERRNRQACVAGGLQLQEVDGRTGEILTHVSVQPHIDWEGKACRLYGLYFTDTTAARQAGAIKIRQLI